MAALIYSALTSLDGYIEDEFGGFDWAMPDEEVHGFVNELERSIGTYLLGRRMYEVMQFWDEPLPDADPPQAMTDFADIWRDADKVVHSTTLKGVSTPRTSLVRDFDPEAVGRLKTSSRSDLSIGGPELAAAAFRAGLVDQVQLFISPVIVGGGKPALPTGVRCGLTLTDEHRFTNGVVFLRYRLTA